MPIPIPLLLDPGQLDDDDLELLVKSPQLRLYEAAYEKRTGHSPGPLSEEGKHFVVSGLISLILRDPRVSVALGIGHGLYHLLFDSGGSGGPSVAVPTSTKVSKRSESGRTSSAKGYSAHGFSSGKAPTARGKCPKGHYWSYKKKKCVKSKF